VRPELTSYIDLKEKSRLPRRLTHEIKRILKEFAPARGSRPHQRLAEIEKVWRQVVGEGIANKSQVSSYKRGVLMVQVESTPLAAELANFARQTLLKELASRGLEGIHDIKFKTAARPAGGSRVRKERNT